MNATAFKIKIKLLYIQMGKVLWVIRLRMLQRRAMRLHRKYNEQFFIVKLGGRITLMGKSGFKSLRQNKILPLSYTATDLKRISIFYTPSRYDKKRVPRTFRKV